MPAKATDSTMSRRQRRIANKLGKQPATPAVPDAAAGVRIAELLDTARRYHQAGQLAQAEGYYRKILAIDPNHADSLHLLGVIAHQVGRSDMAVDLIRKAIALNDRNPTFHNNIGLALDALGRTEDAVAYYGLAITLNPNYVDAQNNLGATLLAQGKLDEAAAHYQRVLALKPDFAEAHNNLGNAFKEQGRLDEAVARYQRALLLKPNYVEAQYNLGNAFKEQGKLDEATTQYQQALSLKPDYAEAHNNLGNVLQEQGKVDEAMAHLRHALAVSPDYAEAHNNLGNALREQGRLDEAVARYQRALALKPDFAEAHNNLGTTFNEQGRLDEAVAQYCRALAFDPDDAEAYGNLGKALMDGGDFAQALNAIQRGIEIDESENIKLLFVQCVRNLDHIPDGVDLRQNLIRALSEPWGRPIYLAKFSARLLKLGGAIRACVNRVTSAWPRRQPAQEIFSAIEFAEICNDQLFRCFLTSTHVCDIELERFLTATRFTLLEAAGAGSDSHQIEEDALCFFCAVAQQCFINEYVFAHTDCEMDQAQRLQVLLVEALSSGTSIPELWLVAVAAYFPLADLPVADFILSRLWSAPVAALVARQVRERQEERQLQASVPCLTLIENDVSLLVKQQYEESPYPPWMKASPVGKSMTIDGYLRRQFPLVSLRNVSKKSSVEILVAGCGTGQHSVETAQRFIGAQVLAIDLSLTSLCYAKRKTRELGLNNIEYAQADILQLESIGRAFDVIEASGVLHHLAAPMAGWRLLLSMLRPGGFMCLGLYSKVARQDLVDVRRFIAKRGYGPSAEDIRRCRQELTGVGDDTPLSRATELLDFFSTSACRDLLFHVQEHQLTLPMISSFLRQNRLEFLGFHLPGHVLQNFRQRFPNDKTMTDLNLWHIFEIENPSIFAGMYQFWIQKT
jgi:tetratricopeptide (TPR) repeat protein/2-polyprenyl-3-methyl-5-hydroxy-6-metoxy-1,4-benzoquinol methylase